jgi:hypothetical protein
VKRLVDAIKYKGPVAFGGDCIKLKARLTYSTEFGAHILGSVLPLNEVEVDDADDINDVIEHIKRKKAQATQVRAMLVRVSLHQ